MTVSRMLASACVLLLAACTSATGGRGSAGPSASGGAVSTSPSSTSTSTSPSAPASTSAPVSASGSPQPAPHTAVAVFDSMSLAERVGQLFMVDCPTSGITSATIHAIQAQHVGSVILDGTSEAGSAAISALTRALESANPAAAKLFIATDQEGGEVQRLQGPGFAQVPSGVEQGTLSTHALQADATLWGQQLRAAGVTIDLAPVLDTVPPGGAPNPPIGDLDREYGNDPATVSAHGSAVIAGLAAAGVDASAKHFPGLGRVTGNTDTSAGVTDAITTRHDAYLAPFATAVANGVPFVMMSTASYAKLDPGRPAAFSSTIVTGMLRGDLGFRGVIISDDLGAARQVAAFSFGQRAVDFIAAGGDMVLTVDASVAPAMVSAVLARAQSNATFRAQVNAAAMLVLQAKQARGLL